MEWRSLGDSAVQVSVVSLGTWAIGGWEWGGTDENKSVAAIRKAIDLGINCIDTAPMYGFGLAEKLVARAIEGRRDQVIIATKCGLRWDTEEGERFFDTDDPNGKRVWVYRNLKKHGVIEECERSLRRLKTDWIDLYQCHWPDSTTPLEATMEALIELRVQGKIRAIGVSNFTAHMMEGCFPTGPVHSNQTQYSMLTRKAEQEELPFCREHDIAVLAYGPLERGLLTGKVTMEREFPEGDGRPWEPWFKPANRRRALEFLQKIQPIADGHGVTLTQLAINWIICQPGMASAIVGARNDEQVAENAKGAGWRLSQEELAIIRRELSLLGDPE
jgi:methylglyoxal reductase